MIVIEEDDGFERDNDDAMVLDMKVQDIRVSLYRPS